MQVESSRWAARTQVSITSLFNLCCVAPASDGKVYPVHNCHMTIDDSVLYKGTAIFVQAAFDYLNN